MDHIHRPVSQPDMSAGLGKNDIRRQRFHGLAVPVGCRSPAVSRFKAGASSSWDDDFAAVAGLQVLGAADVVEVAVGQQQVAHLLGCDPAGLDVGGQTVPVTAAAASTMAAWLSKRIKYTAASPAKSGRNRPPAKSRCNLHAICSSFWLKRRLSRITHRRFAGVYPPDGLGKQRCHGKGDDLSIRFSSGR